MKTSLTIIALLMTTSAFAQVRPRPADPVRPKTEGQVRIEEKKKEELRMAADPHATSLTAGEQVLQKLTEIGKTTEDWDTATVDNYMKLSEAVANAPAERKADVAVEMLAMREGRDPETLTKEDRKALLDKLRECR